MRFKAKSGSESAQNESGSEILVGIFIFDSGHLLGLFYIEINFVRISPWPVIYDVGGREGIFKLTFYSNFTASMQLPPSKKCFITRAVE